MHFFSLRDGNKKKPCLLKTKVGILCVHGNTLSICFRITLLWKKLFRSWEDVKTTVSYQRAAAIIGSMLGAILSLQSVSDVVLADFSVELCIHNPVLGRIKNIDIFIISLILLVVNLCIISSASINSKFRNMVEILKTHMVQF